ncbi:MAG: hypothetical protein K1T65_03330 [Candidatus Aramenus sp.]|uniref:Uncharacterized protein n=2 Tax=Candidatus Aramenus sulfurataquae TaxID=1326980 RepID=A0A0F2LMP6_9CREN|nr:hypothetical protein [Candidatus Aramenus sp.]MCL7343177.1 hypothetical protein [Candidatus Aramenus sulfurataquae]
MEIPEDVKKSLDEGKCVVCCDNVVVCMTEDYPRVPNPPVDIEVDREGKEIVLRNIVKDDVNNPLYLEYYVDKNFVQKVSELGFIRVVFVAKDFSEEGKLDVKLNREDLLLIRREVGLGSF